MRNQLYVTATIIAFLAGASERVAAAITLPDTGSCPGTTSSACLTISQSGTGSGLAVVTSNTNATIVGLSGGSGPAVLGTNASSGFGVKGVASAAGTGSAIVGDAGNSGTAWAGNFVGDVNASGSYYTNGSFVASDGRLKTDIRKLSYGLEQLLNLRPVSYRWKQDKDQGTKLGLIAQELQQVVPEVVGTNRATGMLAVDYAALIPLTIKAIQEQQMAFRKQEARIDALEQALARKPTAWSLSSGGFGVAGLALGLLPVGLVLARRRGRADRR